MLAPSFRANSMFAIFASLNSTAGAVSVVFDSQTCSFHPLGLIV